jgi:chromosomal replication initiation ATPase DnaA
MLDRTNPQWSQAKAISIINDECSKAGVDLAVLKQDIRLAKYVEVRRNIAIRLRTGLGMSYERIGMLLDREHSSVINMIRRTSSHKHQIKYVPKALREKRI